VPDKRYEQARATKVSGKSEFDSDSIKGSTVRKGYRKIKKSPLLIIIAVSLIVGIVAGFFITKSTSAFKMNGYSVNGISATEVDYVVVDMTTHKDNLVDADQKGAKVGVSMDQVYATMNLVDGGVTAKFLGMDITDTVTVKYYYREDISHDMKEVSKIDVSTAGVYYIEYTSSHFAYKDVVLIRTIIVTGVEVDG